MSWPCACSVVRAGPFFGLRDLGQRLAGNASEYLTEESALLVTRPELERLREQSAGLAQRLDELERRLNRLDVRRRES